MTKNTLPAQDPNDEADHSAADLIRQKVERIYDEEPDAAEELEEVEAGGHKLSKHQQYMLKLQTSGNSFADIQTAWHKYYLSLPEEEKLEVWQEFYDANERTSRRSQYAAYKPVIESAEPDAKVFEHRPAHPAASRRGAKQLKNDLKSHITKRARAEAKKNSLIRSLGFGLSMGLLVILIFLFSFFNEVIITPFIQPSRHVSATPLIINSSTIAPNATPEIIIPKINVEIPVDYNQTSDDESVIEGALNNGVVHYPSTVLPGQNGNAAFFGHSSNNIFNPGKYKFAFVLLHTLVKGDIFYLTYNQKVYAYQVIDRRIVPPNDVGVLNDTEGH